MTETNKNNVKDTKDDVVYFKLNTAVSAYWGLPDRSVVLSYPAAAVSGVGSLYGMIDKKSNPYGYDAVMRGIESGSLIKVTKKEYESNKSSKTKVQSVEINSQIESKIAIDRKIESILRLTGDNGEKTIISYIRSVNDADVLSRMLKVEEAGKKRTNIIKEIEIALRKTNANGFSGIINEGSNQYEIRDGVAVPKE